jgi:beta-aspartyl-peptidase (threonine type)
MAISFYYFIFVNQKFHNMQVKKGFLIITAILLTIPGWGQQPWALVIHGGAGVMSKEKMNEVRQQEYIQVLNKALEVGEKMLRKAPLQPMWLSK